jgi:hypothetical protein
MSAAKFEPRLVQYNEHFHFADFGLLLLVACIILLWNHKLTGFGKPHAYRGPMCASENCRWCGEPYFVGSFVYYQFYVFIHTADEKTAEWQQAIPEFSLLLIITLVSHCIVTVYSFVWPFDTVIISILTIFPVSRSP